jgi:hypothetical protein
LRRDAATNLLPADNSGSEVSTTWQKSDHVIDLEALAAGALDVVEYHTACAATEPNGLALLPLDEGHIAHGLNRHDSH